MSNKDEFEKLKQKIEELESDIKMILQSAIIKLHDDASFVKAATTLLKKMDSLGDTDEDL